MKFAGFRVTGCENEKYNSCVVAGFLRHPTLLMIPNKDYAYTQIHYYFGNNTIHQSL